MNSLTGAEMISLLIQVPLLGVFVWFTLRILQLHREEREQRDADWRKWLQNQADTARTFLGEQQDHYLDAIQGVALQLTKHNEQASQMGAQILHAIKERNGRG